MTDILDRPKPTWQRLYEYTAWNPWCDTLYVLALLLGEALLCFVIIEKVAYTEIDWTAYMEEVECYLKGERDYLQIRGGTGPLVYPAGFVYLFVALRAVTHQGTDIRQAQYIFAGFYLLTLTAVLYIYHCTLQTAKTMLLQQQQQSTTSSTTQPQKLRLHQAHLVWSWRLAMACLCCSKRLHSIFILRLFNDGPTMMFLYLSIGCFVTTQLPSTWKWSLGCFLFSLAVSVKMNVLLFAPGLLLLLLQVSRNLQQVVYRLLVFCALPQLILGAPFLLTHPVSYLRKAFELDRVFFYKWTVNWKFLPEEIFVSKPLSILLLSLHLGALAFFCKRWLNATKAETGKRIFLFDSKNTDRQQQQQQQQLLSPIYIASTLFTSNYIGICFARTLHYQFYSWYFHSLPFLLWCNSIASTNSNKATGTIVVDAIPHRILLLAVIEIAFLTFPATPTSSSVLQLAHMAILLRIQPPPVLMPAASPPVSTEASSNDKSKERVRRRKQKSN